MPFPVRTQAPSRDVPNDRPALWLLVLSGFDALATDIGLRAGVVTEGNPWAEWLYDTHAAAFYSYKLVLPLLLLVLLKKVSKDSFVRKWVLAGAIGYGAVAVYHLAWMAYAWMRLAE